MKATLVLLPLLGITYMLFFVNPGEDEVSRVVFIYFNSFLESFQVPKPSPHSALAAHPPPPAVSVLPGRGLEGQEAREGRGCPETGWGHMAQSLDGLLPPRQGFFVSVFYCFLNSEVRTRAGAQDGGGLLGPEMVCSLPLPFTCWPSSLPPGSYRDSLAAPRGSVPPAHTAPAVASLLLCSLSS